MDSLALLKLVSEASLGNVCEGMNCIIFFLLLQKTGQISMFIEDLSRNTVFFGDRRESLVICVSHRYETRKKSGNVHCGGGGNYTVYESINHPSHPHAVLKKRLAWALFVLL